MNAVSKDIKYRRILLKLSGEALMGTREFGLETDTVGRIAGEVKSVLELGCEVCLVIGGGNIFRGVEASSQGLERGTADYMGMLGTVINSLALQSNLKKIGVESRVMTAISINRVAEPYIKNKATNHLDKNRVVIFASGTGNPYFTTDSAAVLRAIEINADVILKGTRVDGIYNEDPEKNKEAIKFDDISFEETIRKGLKIMDTTAFTLSKENKLPIIVFDMNTKGNLTKVIMGEKIGTKVSS